ncbi:MAG: hypothetical protein R2911_21840 [Caldilineaceae bacterium]
MEYQPDLQPEYASFLLRLWHIKSEDRAGHRIMLQNIATQEQFFFVDLPALLAYLSTVADPGRQHTDHEYL